MKNSTESKVYILVSLCGAYAKIGYAKNIPRRLRDVQTSCPFPLAIYREYSAGKASQVEVQLHKRFEGSRIRGEWFQGSPVIEALGDIYTDKQLSDFLMS